MKESLIGKLDDGTRVYLNGDPDRGFWVTVDQPNGKVASWAMADVMPLSTLLQRTVHESHEQTRRWREILAKEQRVRETGEDVEGPGEGT